MNPNQQQGIKDLLQGLAQIIKRVRDPDSQSRQAFQNQLIQDPSMIQKLANSSAGQDPMAYLKSLGLSNARFGRGSDDLDAISKQIQSAPVGDEERVRRLSALGTLNPNDISNASKKIPQLNGVFSSNQQFQQALPNIASGSPTDILNDEQKDIRSKSLGLPTSAQQAQAKATLAGTEAGTRGAEQDLIRSKQEVAKGQLGFDADKVVDDYFKQNPSQRARPLYELWDSASTPQEVRDAITASNKYSKSFDSQFSKNLENQRLDISKKQLAQGDKRLVMDQKQLDQSWARTTYVQAADAWRTAGMIGGTAGLKGYQDAFGGNPDTPEAQAALKQGGIKLQNDMITKYNAAYAKLSQNEKKMSADAIQADVDNLNAMTNVLNALGVPKKQLKYGPAVQGKTLTDRVQNSLPDIMKPNSIQTIDGEKPSAVDTTSITKPTAISDDMIKNMSADDYKATMADPNLTPELRQRILTLYKVKK